MIWAVIIPPIKKKLAEIQPESPVPKPNLQSGQLETLKSDYQFGIVVIFSFVAERYGGLQL